MANWTWKILLVIVIVEIFYICYLKADDTVQKLPFCNPTVTNDGPVYDDVMIASTLDGKLTAFSTQSGLKLWEVETQPLLSSNIHHVELSSGGKWVRLVPSLRGTLYGLSGETIEPLPLDAEQLLSASYKYSDDLVIAGAKESVWYGVDARSGRVVYECSSHGCSSEQAASAGHLLVLRRHANTVRALDPRVGNEKWNFSVAEHQLALSRGECVGPSAPTIPAHYGVAVELHDGRLALRAPGSAQILWQQQLEAPLAGLWRLSGGGLEGLDVVREGAGALAGEAHAQSPSLYIGVHERQVLWCLSGGGLEGLDVVREGAVAFAGEAHAQSPSLYIGVHERQLYVQESATFTPKLETAVAASPLPWKLIVARPLIGSETALQLQDPDNTLSKVALYGPTALAGEYGFFLYLQETCDQSVQVSVDAIDSSREPDPEPHHIHVHVYSLWFWWKEVLLIAVSSALLMNLMIWPRFFAPKLRPPTPQQIRPLHQECIVVERHYERPSPPPPEYVCRYESDFTPLRYLGKGGFGVVIEARNNIDHCSYAVKRITLPKKEEKRERVLREVRALAKLDHTHIVRYFNAWVEQPPPAWQQQRDAQLMRELADVSLVMSEEYSATSPAPPLPAKTEPKDVTLDLQQPLDNCIDALDFERQLEPAKRIRSQSCSDSFSIEFDEGAKDVTSSKDPSTRSIHSGDVTNTLSKHVPTDDDSYVVFEHSHADNVSGLNTSGRHSTHHNTSAQRNSGYSGARNNSVDKRLQRIKECDDKTESTIAKKKKKGHTRHWSLDMVVKSNSTQPDVISAQRYLYIQMQLCRRDSLHDWLRNNRTIEARGAMARTLFSQIVSAVEYVHLAGLIHRDLKPSNILFALDGKVKVGDFGLVTAMGDTSSDGEKSEEVDNNHRHTYRVGTHLYMSPEQLQGLPYSYKVDIYSLGLILFELLQPFGTEAERVSCLMKIRNEIFPPQFHHDYPSETNVLKLMLSEDPSLRPTASGVKARAPLYETTEEKYHFTLPAMAAA